MTALFAYKSLKGTVAILFVLEEGEENGNVKLHYNWLWSLNVIILKYSTFKGDINATVNCSYTTIYIWIPTFKWPLYVSCSSFARLKTHFFTLSTSGVSAALSEVIVIATNVVE